MPGTCLICGKPNGRNKKCCSHACYSAYRQHHKVCIICGKEFADPPSSERVTCQDPECSRIHRQNIYAKGVNDAALQKAHEMAPLRPLSGRFETHVNAKSWVIQAPDGKIYECRNLKNWLREHADLLDGTVAQAWDGISKIKYSMQGKRKRPCSQWKGWRLLRYGE